MKKPRIDAFDPTAPAALKSSFEAMPSIQKPPQRTASHEEDSTVTVAEREDDRTGVRAYGRTPKKQRSITRYAFEFYQDQLDLLRRISLEEKMQGEKGSMSEMVREALDDYLAKRESSQ